MGSNCRHFKFYSNSWNWGLQNKLEIIWILKKVGLFVHIGPLFISEITSKNFNDTWIHTISQNEFRTTCPVVPPENLWNFLDDLKSRVLEWLSKLEYWPCNTKYNFCVNQCLLEIESSSKKPLSITKWWWVVLELLSKIGDMKFFCNVLKAMYILKGPIFWNQRKSSSFRFLAIFQQ